MEAESPYNPEFVKMIQQGDEDLKAGKGVKVDIDKFFIERIEKGLKDVEEGRVLSYEEAKQKFF
jgi:predicted transcriptional regulator